MRSISTLGFLAGVVAAPSPASAASSSFSLHPPRSPPPVAAQMIKRSVNAISGALDRSVMHMDFDQHHLAADTSDAAEAVSAYLEKRPPTFTGN